MLRGSMRIFVFRKGNQSKYVSGINRNVFWDERMLRLAQPIDKQTMSHNI